jgi:AraC-like DNA-binding protein
MASKSTKVVSTVKRKGDGPAIVPASAKVPAKPNAARNAAAQANAKKARAKAIKPLRKAKVVAVEAPRAIREEPHVVKTPAEGHNLVDCLNATLRKQLRERKVTNEAAAEALGVHPTYLSRILKDMGEEKVKGATMAHREARNELVAARNKHRAELAKKVNRQEITIEKAAKDANCSVRTMFRWCAEYANVKKAA